MFCWSHGDQLSVMFWFWNFMEEVVCDTRESECSADDFSARERWIDPIFCIDETFQV